MRKIYVIGIGAGDPDHLTLQAVKALREVDVFFILDKGEAKDDLIRLRREILDRHARPADGSAADGPSAPGYRVVSATDPDRDRRTPAYAPAVDDWRRRRADIYERLIRDELPADACGAFLVWGDPALYDSTLAILEDVRARGSVAFDHEVIPGISSVSALAAKHRTGLNQVGRPVQITTGRRLAAGLPPDVDDIVVMLDAHQSFTRYANDEGLHIYWGAYVGTEDEILVSGPLPEVADEITRLRAEARERKGWIMDSYLLRRTASPDASPNASANSSTDASADPSTGTSAAASTGASADASPEAPTATSTP